MSELKYSYVPIPRYKIPDIDFDRLSINELVIIMQKAQSALLKKAKEAQRDWEEDDCCLMYRGD